MVYQLCHFDVNFISNEKKPDVASGLFRELEENNLN